MLRMPLCSASGSFWPWRQNKGRRGPHKALQSPRSRLPGLRPVLQGPCSVITSPPGPPPGGAGAASLQLMPFRACFGQGKKSSSNTKPLLWLHLPDRLKQASPKLHDLPANPNRPFFLLFSFSFFFDLRLHLKQVQSLNF